MMHIYTSARITCDCSSDGRTDVCGASVVGFGRGVSEARNDAVADAHHRGWILAGPSAYAPGHVVADVATDGAMTNTSTTAHTIRWFVYAAPTERIPHVATMRGRWGYDAVCSCGWDSRTGGALRRHVADMVADHKAGLR